MKNWIPILIITIAMAVLYFSGLWKSLDYETLRYHHNELTEYVNQNPVMTPFLYVGSYIVATTLMLPGMTLFSALGGFLFKQPWAFLYVLFGATTGATLLFLAVKTSIGNFLKKKAGPFLSKMEKGFNKNAVYYLLFMRFLPFFPFWLANLAPAFFNIRLRTYIWTTLVGIAPKVFVATQMGRGLGVIFESYDQLTLRAIFNTQTIIALVSLAIVSLIPIVIKRFQKQNK